VKQQLAPEVLSFLQKQQEALYLLSLDNKALHSRVDSLSVKIEAIESPVSQTMDPNTSFM